jgi:squalene synthase HpnC
VDQLAGIFRKVNNRQPLDGTDSPFRGVSLPEASEFCRRLAKGRYENFHLVNLLIPRGLRRHFYHVYAYCRTADDLADETGNPVQSLKLLDDFESHLRDCYNARPSGPIFVALAETIREFEIPKQPFLDLVSAFRQDQVQFRYASHADVYDYCRRSAHPVGRLVLYLGRAHRHECLAPADAICTGLQLANFCQDVARDFDLGRIYLPQDQCRGFGYTEEMFAVRLFNGAFRELMKSEVERAAAYLYLGSPLVEMMPRELRVQTSLFIRGGLSVLDAIRRLDYNVWKTRPVVTKWKKLGLLLNSWIASHPRRPARPRGAPTSSPRPRIPPSDRAP